MELNTQTGLFTAKQLALRIPWLRLGGLRKWLSERRYNGLGASGAVICMSTNRLLIDEEKFLEWVKSHRETR